ncbi:hypothetical protein GCM10009804_17010 [Kribbella hippodromi]|uniref:Right-handed parallel beta-helix repeat-containing protein n=1 Tax=Kribbella hippodromi TaxID=434347 RepID=A0ABN2CN28_9ACTN
MPAEDNGYSRRAFLITSAAAAGAVAGPSLLQPSAAAAVPARPMVADASQTFVVTRNGSDTSVIQAQLDLAATTVSSGVATVIVPYDGQDWMTDPLFVGWHPTTDYFRTGAAQLHLILEPGVVVKAQAAATIPAATRMLTIGGNANARPTAGNHGYSAWGVVITGYGAVFDGNDPNHTRCNDLAYQQNSAICMFSAGNVLIEGLTLRNASGDGIQIQPAKNNASINNYCGGDAGAGPIHIVNVTCDNNGRNGMSVAAVDGLLVTGSAFTGSDSGTNASGQFNAGPCAGIDFEPDQPWTYSGGTITEYGRLSNILVQDCVMENNVNCGVQYQGAHLKTATDIPNIGITLDRVRLGAQKRSSAAGGAWTYPNFLLAGDGQSAIGGNLTMQYSMIATSPIQRSLLIANNWSGSIPTDGSVQPADGTLLSLNNSVCFDWNNVPNATGDHVIDIWSYDYSNGGPVDYGHVAFNQFMVMTAVGNDNFLKAVDAPSGGGGVANISGTLHVVDPNGATSSFGANPRNVTCTIDATTALPASTVTMAMTPATVAPGQQITLTVTRSSADVSRPLAVTYALSGTAKARYDYDGIPGVVVIPAGQTSRSVTFTARRFDSGTDTRTATVTLTTTPSVSTYTLGAAKTATTSIT